MSLSPEYGLLLDAIHAAGETRACEDWEDARWEQAARAAAWHRLAPLLHAHLASRERPPASVLGALERAYVDNAARNLFVGAALERVLQALAAASIPAMLLKGAALIELAYPDPALRELTDLDILVPFEQLDPANDALAGVGYGGAYPQTSEDRTAPWMRENHFHDPPLVTSDRIAAVELHHHIALREEGAQFVIDGVWQRARPSAAGTHLLPSPEDLLLHVGFHFMRNRGGTSRGALAQICDIAAILRAEAIDWRRLVCTLREYGLDASVFLALFAARELGVPIPDRVLADLRPAGFDPRVGRRLVALRVLRCGASLPVRKARWIVAPPREALETWTSRPQPGTWAMAQAYSRRAVAQLPQIRSALRHPRSLLQDYRLDGQIGALVQHPASTRR